MRSISLLAVRFLMAVGSSVSSRSKSKATPRDLPDSSPQYFPKDTFLERSKSGEIFDLRTGWYTSHLRSMQEPSLFEASEDKTAIAYRFLWLRTFHNPIAVRLAIRVDGTGKLNGKLTNGIGGYMAGSLTVDESHEITRAQVANFLVLLQKAAFWSSPTQVMSLGMDGAQWIMEGIENGRYHLVDRWSPKESDHKRACLYLLELSTFKVEPEEIY